MKRLYLKLTCFCMLMTQIVQAQDEQKQRVVHEFSVQQAVEYARSNNVQVKNALLDLKIQEQTNRGITAAALPHINGGLGTTYYPNVPVQVFPNFIAAATYGVLAQEGVKDGSGNPITVPSDVGYVEAAFGSKWNASATVTLSQILFDGQVFVGLQARDASIELAKKSIDVTDENIRVNIYKVYYQLVASSVQMAQIDANITRAEKLRSDLSAMFKNGFAEQLDVNRASVQLANLQTEKKKIQTTINNGYLGLKLLMGMPVADSLVLTDQISEDKIKEGILDNEYQYSDRNDFQYLTQLNKLNEYNVKRYKYSYLPSANFATQFGKQAYRGQFDFFKGDWYTSWYLGLNINIPIFNGFSKDADLKKARFEMQQVSNQLDNLKLTIDNEVAQARNRFLTAIETLDFQKKNMDLAEQVYNQSKKKYESGIGSNSDITNAQTDLITAQTNYTSALYDAIIAKIDYNKAIGKL